MESMKEVNDKKLESLESKLIEVTAQIISLKNEGNKVRHILPQIEVFRYRKNIKIIS